MPIRAVHVNTSSFVVDNRFDFTSLSAIATQNNLNPRWIGQPDWAEGQGEPVDGTVWDGNIPATFTAAAVDPDAPSTLAEAYANLQAAQDAVAVASAALAALIPV